MGAETFICMARGSNAEIAFEAAREKALYDHGHSGYSGTIAEKSTFVEIKVPEGLDPKGYGEKLLDDGDPRIDSKWGPAGCVRIAVGEYMFFGWASS